MARGAGSHSAGHRRWAQGWGAWRPAGRGPEPGACRAVSRGPGGRGRHLVGCKRLPGSPLAAVLTASSPLPVPAWTTQPCSVFRRPGQRSLQTTVFPPEYGEGGGLAMSTRASVFQIISSFPEKARTEICVLLAARTLASDETVCFAGGPAHFAAVSPGAFGQGGCFREAVKRVSCFHKTSPATLSGRGEPSPSPKGLSMRRCVNAASASPPHP